MKLFIQISVVIFLQLCCFNNLKAQRSTEGSFFDISIKTVDLSSYKYFDNSETVDNQNFKKRLKSIPSAYNFDELGFFCKAEVKLEQRAKIPIKIRLGEVHQVERLEGKPSVQLPWNINY